MSDGATWDALKAQDVGGRLPKVYVLGNSISKQYTPFLQAYLWDVFEVARNEEAGDSALALSVLKGKLEAGGLDADILLLNCGLHDIKTDSATGRKQVSIEDYRRNLREIIAVARRMRPQLVWVRTTLVEDARHNKPGARFFRYSADNDAYIAAADEIMRAGGVPVIDLHSFTRKLGPDLFCDHVHYKEEVRQKQAACLGGWLMCWLANRPPVAAPAPM